MGEPVHQGRGIRIAANPLGEQRDCSRESSPSPPPSEAAMGDQIETAVAATASVLAGYGAEQDSGLAVSGVGSHAFARMEQNPDSDASRWQKRVGSCSGGGGAGVGKGAGGSGRVNAGGRRQTADVIRADQVLSSERRYDRWLRRARQQDLSRLRAARCLFHSGHDVHGRPVIVVIGSRMPPLAQRNYEDLALLVLSVLEPLVGQPYVLLYAHCGYDALPHSAFLKELRDLLTGDPRWSSNLACLIHLHADRRTRMFWWWFARFTAPGLCQQFADCLQEVFHLVGPDQLDLPDSVYELDRRVAKETKIIGTVGKPAIAEPARSPDEAEGL
ncbi:hypothetical protein BOX15_Mlig025672g2 [Macrostomum lignano]|uniref:CRAL-TRIO domain-containing protein n=1 Tax=Macrostomum lignano TaxID=282301 RepID=A0A267FHE1_9PLAT|nr:hypothetical protein BOX15_Mlig025672g2 [Macrostomum lignano]